MLVNLRKAAGAAALGLLVAICTAATAHAPASLKKVFKRDFLVGAALNAAQITGRDQRGDAIVEEQFNSISPENALKWQIVHPQNGRYNFSLADQYVAFGRKHRMFIVGHNLVWHKQVPAWVFRDENGNLLSRDALLERLRDHIFTVVGRYKGKIQSWDVVNEALNDDGTLRQSLWLKIIGPDYIAKAFEYAHQADPKAQLTYNDYDLEKPAKRAGAVALIKKLQSEGVPITSVGLQNHDSLTWPTAEEEDATISAFAALGLKVAISELDVDVLPSAGRHSDAGVNHGVQQNSSLNPYGNGLPDAVQKQLAQRYADLFRVFLKHRGEVMRVTFWGVSDASSWLNNRPVRGRSNYPLLFGRDGEPKPAFDAVVGDAAEQPE